MPTFRDCYEIDTQEFSCNQAIRLMSLEEIGRFVLKMNKAYVDGDFDFLRSLPFVEKIHPRRGIYRHIYIPAAIRREVLSSGPCVTCGTTERLTIDHRIPVSKGGSDDRSNLQPMCSLCNIRKHDKI